MYAILAIKYVFLEGVHSQILRRRCVVRNRNNGISPINCTYAHKGYN